MNEGARKADPPRSTDADIVKRITAAVHEPFREAWQSHEHDCWLPVRRALEDGLAVHERALASETMAGYRRTVAADVLGPVRAALGDSGWAARLEASIARAAAGAAEAGNRLPAQVRAPLSPTALRGGPGLDPWTTAKRICALVLRPIVWRHEERDVPMARVARRHLARVVLPHQARAFRESQCLRAVWLGDLERASSAWLTAVHGPAVAGEAGSAGAGARRAGEQLHRKLGSLAESVPRASGRPRGGNPDRSEATLRAAVAVAGTFVGGEDGPQAEWDPRASETAGRWDRRACESAARLELCGMLLDEWSAIGGIHTDLTAGWEEAARGIDAVLAEVEACLDRGRQRAERLAVQGPGLARALRREQQRTIDDLAEAEGRLPDPARLLAGLTRDADEALKRVEAAAALMSASLVVHRIPPAGTPIRRPGSGGHPVRLRDAAVQAFDAHRGTRIRSAPSAVSEAMARVHLMVAELREVSAYGYEAAIAELSERGEVAAADPVRMVTNGLDRAGGKAEEARRTLFDSLEAAERRAGAEVSRGLAHLFERATADPVTARYLDLRRRAASETARLRELWRTRIVRMASGVSRAFRAAVSRLWPVRRALGIAGDVQGREELRTRTLAFADEIPGNLPVVYRRLFSFEALSDPRLLAGRKDALATAEVAWDRCRAGHVRSLMVVAPPGAGITSFLNILARKLGAEDAEAAPDEAPGVVRQPLRKRVRDEPELARRLAGWLGVADAPDLDSLAARILDAPEAPLPRAVVLEGTEKLHMRVPGGGRLFERLLSFVARTESRVFWVLSMAASAWQLAEKRSPAWVSDIERIALNALSPDDLKRAVLARHRLSGLPLKYVEPRTGREMLLRRARSLRGTQKQQQLIEADYFQKLHRASLGSIRLALFHWLRSADFKTVQGSLLVRPLEMLDPFAGALNVEQSFALKAILDHGTLTVAEFCEVARGSLSERRHLFRTLMDIRVIAAVPGVESTGPGSVSRSDVPDGPPAPEAAYCIRPIMNGPVAADLRSRNVLH